MLQEVEDVVNKVIFGNPDQSINEVDLILTRWRNRLKATQVIYYRSIETNICFSDNYNYLHSCFN